MIVRLKSEKLIEKLFQDGNSLFVYPIKVVYRRIESDVSETKLQVGYSVSKRNFKRAVDRNRIKRQLREAVRGNFGSCAISCESSVDLMMIYVSKDMLEFDIINKAISKLLKKLFKDMKIK